MEFLNLLRGFILNKREHEMMLSDDDVIMGSKKFPMSAKTCFRVLFDPNKKKDNYDFYTVRAILFMLENDEGKHSEYARKAKEECVQVVELADKKQLLGYLRGEIAVPNALDKFAIFDAPKRPDSFDHDVDGEEPPEKKVFQLEEPNSATLTPDPRLARNAADDTTVFYPEQVNNNNNYYKNMESKPLKKTRKIRPTLTPLPTPAKQQKNLVQQNDLIAKAEVHHDPFDPGAMPNFIPPPAAPIFNSGYVWKLMPIIIVPDGEPSLITMCNAQDILQNLLFVPPQKKLAQEENFRKFNSLVIRDKNNGCLPDLFRLVDNPLQLDMDDWNRVVGIFVSGEPRQFQNWPFTLDQIFARFLLFHVKYASDSVDSSLKPWPVIIIKVRASNQPNLQHQNAIAIGRFWKSLDAYFGVKP